MAKDLLVILPYDDTEGPLAFHQSYEEYIAAGGTPPPLPEAAYDERGIVPTDHYTPGM